MLSVNVPVALICRVSPSATDGLAGVTAIDTRVAAVTVSSVEPAMPLVGSVARMVVVPAAIPDARPRVPEIVETVATLPFDDPQSATSVRSREVWSV